MKMTETQFELIKKQLKKLTSQDCFYKRKPEAPEDKPPLGRPSR